jgi:hypothetical protein
MLLRAAVIKNKLTVSSSIERRNRDAAADLSRFSGM